MLAARKAAKTPHVFDEGQVAHRAKAKRLERADEEVSLRPAVENDRKRVARLAPARSR